MQINCRCFIAFTLVISQHVRAVEPVPDVPIPIIETGIRMLDQLPGKFAWLDSDTLAVTTYGDDSVQFPWTVRKIVAFDVRTKTSRNLLARGFLTCVNPQEELVSLFEGDLQSMYVGGSKSPPPVPQFYKWSSSRKELTPAGSEYKTSWNASACLKTRPEDVNGIDWMVNHKPIRYLQPNHGVITWDSVYLGNREPLTLQRGQKSIPLAAKSNELGVPLIFLQFGDFYLLRTATYQNGTQTPVDAPMITMSVDGEITRTLIPTSLKRHLDSVNKSTWANMIATAPGNLVIASGRPADGAGIYLVQGDQSKRIWCTPPVRYEAISNNVCRIEQGPEVSPDGCKIAFATMAPSGLAGPLTIIDLCSGSNASLASRIKDGAAKVTSRTWKAIRSWF